MSGQAKRSRVRAALRHREQVARLIMECQWPLLRDVYGLSRAERVAQILDGHTFDVALARRRAEEMIAEGQRAAETWAVFVDWCREQGLGSESRVHCSACTTVAVTVGLQDMAETIGPAADQPGERSISAPTCTCRGTTRGWPGNLAAEWARGPGRVTCRHCCGDGTHPWTIDPSRTVPFGVAKGMPSNTCHICAGAGLVEGPRPQPGDAQVRMGRRLLAALDGQPSECRSCSGRGRTPESTDEITPHEPIALFDGVMVSVSCTQCRGTGYNLSGALPDIEWSPTVRRKAIDGYRVDSPEEEHYDANRQRIIDSGIDIATVQPRDPHRLVDTRAVPRGQHHSLESMDMVAASNRCVAHASVVNGESLSLWAPVSMIWRHHTYQQRVGLMPRWRRAEYARRRNAGITFLRLGHAARGDGSDCAMCQGSGLMGDVVCDVCLGHGRMGTG